MSELSKSFEMECEILDRDHQELMQQIDKIAAVIDGNDDGRCAKLTPEMIKFAKQHFTREEALLIKVGYPDVKKHAAHHQNLDHKMETILELAAMADENSLAGEKLKSALKFFLADDIIDGDLDFKSFVKDRDI